MMRVFLWVLLAAATAVLAPPTAAQSCTQCKDAFQTAEAYFSQQIGLGMVDLVNPLSILAPGISQKAVVVDQDDCSSAGGPASEVFIDEFKIWVDMSTNILKNMKVSGAATAAGATSGYKAFLTTAVEFNKAFGPGASGGGGVGFGFSILCSDNGKELISMGGGGGGGFGAGVGFGGGGGGQAFSKSVGGGGGCNCATGTCDCQDGADSNSDSNLADMLVESVQQGCRAFTMCGGGGGGGGVSLPGCSFSASFGVAFTGIIEVSANGALTLNSTAPEGLCASDPNNSGGITSAAAVSCANTCQTASDFNGCYCPCFKGQVAGAGLSWADSITCSS